MLDVFGAVLTAVRGKLTASAGLTAEGCTGVYAGTAPEAAVYPYVTIIWSSGGKTNRSPRTDYEQEVAVTGWDTDEARACRMAGYITEALDEASLSLTGGYKCVGGDLISQDPDLEGRDYYRRGQIFSIGFDAS